MRTVAVSIFLMYLPAYRRTLNGPHISLDLSGLMVIPVVFPRLARRNHFGQRSHFPRRPLQLSHINGQTCQTSKNHQMVLR